MLHSLLMNSLPQFTFYEREVSALLATEPSDCVVTKRPLDCFSLKEIFANVQQKDLKVIFCIRDPRAVICSTHKLVPHDYFIGYRFQYFIYPEKGICQPTNPGLAKIYEAWLQNRECVHTLKYEDLLTDPDGTQKLLFDYIGETASERFADFNRKSRVASEMSVALNEIRAIEKDNVQTWKKHPIRIWSEFTENRELFDMLIELGYERDNSWFLEMFKAKLPFAS